MSPGSQPLACAAASNLAGFSSAVNYTQLPLLSHAHDQPTDVPQDRVSSAAATMVLIPGLRVA